MLAIGEVTKEVTKGNTDFFPMQPMDYGKFLVISLGTGSSKVEKKLNAHEAAKWGILSWLTNGGSTPIVDIFTQASADMVDLHLSVVFKALQSEQSYLRIQVYIFVIIIHGRQYFSINGCMHEYMKFKSLLSLQPF